MSKVTKIRICDLGETVTGKTPSSKNPEDFGQAYPFVTPTDSFESKFISKTERYLSETGMRRLKSKLLPPFSLLVTCIGSAMGKVALIKSPSITNQQINSIRVNRAKFDPDYVYYALRNNYKMLRNAASGSTALPILNKTDFDALKIGIHEFLSTQQKIASVLSALDAKIELNNRINVELEAMAKTLYDYWFVQFDFPDKKGKQYKASGGKMVWNEKLKREIPDGWDVVGLSDIANITMGQSPPGESYNELGDGAIFYQGCTDFGNRFPKIRQYTTQPSRYAAKGDILLSVRAPVGTINIANDNCCIGRGLAALNSKEDCITYLYGVMNNLKQIFDRRNVDGTTFGAITKDDLFRLAVIKPSNNVMKQYQKIILPTFKMQNTIEVENIHLSDLRDWLLPMLMNGQVKVN
jgi:type I restriction enzyme, S subunit